MGSKAHDNKTIKQIATTGKYITNLYVVSDDEDLVNTLLNSLNNKKYRLLGFESDGKRIIKFLDFLSERRSSPNVLLLDMDINSSLYSEILSAVERLEIPHIIIIDDITDEIIEMLTSGNSSGYLLKPFGMEELERAIDVCVKKYNINNFKAISAKNKIKGKNIELVVEKLDSIFLLIICAALIIYGIKSGNVVWFQYILFILALSMLLVASMSFKKQEKPIAYEHPPFVSVIIPVHNGEQTIIQTISSISQMDYTLGGKPNFELIVVNDGSTDSTGEILSELKEAIPELKIITRQPPKSGKGKGFVLNDALKLSKGDIIGVFNADARVEKDFLNIVIPYLNNEKVAGVQTRIKVYNKDEGFLANMQHLELEKLGNTLIAKDNLGKCGLLSGNGQFIKKDSIIDIGEWDGFAATTDLNLSVKILTNGEQIRYCGETAVYQEAVHGWYSLLKQRIKWAVGNFETIFIYLPKILISRIPLIRKYGIIEHIFFYIFNLLIFIGFVVSIAGVISWFVYPGITVIRTDALVIVGLISLLAFVPGISAAVVRGDGGALKHIKDIVSYWIYCFHIIPLFFVTMLLMIFRIRKGGGKN